MTYLRSTLVRVGVLALACCLVLANCGNDDDTSSAQIPPTPQATAGATSTPDPSPPPTEHPSPTPVAETSEEASEPDQAQPEPEDTEEQAQPEPEETEEEEQAQPEPELFPVVIEHALGSTEISSEPMVVVSASGTLTGHLLAIDIPVAAAQVLAPQSPLTDEHGFMLQWADAALAAGIEAIPGPEVNIEAIAAINPDLILGNSFGGDAITEDVYGLLSQIAPTLAIDHSGMQWQELAEILARATGRQEEANAEIAEFEARIAELAAEIDTPYPVVAGVITARGVNVFTPVSSHGKLLASLGLDVVDVEGGNLEGEQGAATRADVVSVSPELIPDLFGNATILFVFGTQDDIEQAIELYPTIELTPAAAEGRLVPLGPESFRLDRYSAALTAERVAEALSQMNSSEPE